MRIPLFAKIFAGHLFIIGALSALILVFSFGTIRDHYIDTLAADLANFARATIPVVSPRVTEGQIAQVEEFAKKLGKDTGIRITVIDGSGRVIADSSQDASSMENHRDRPEVAEALSGRTARSVRYSSTRQGEMLYVALPVVTGGAGGAVVRVSVPLGMVQTLTADIDRTLARSASIIAVIALFAAALIARNLAAPIRELRVAARRLGAGDFRGRVFLNRRDELKDLADTFNEMSEEMGGVFADLTREKEERDSIIHALREGLLVMDREGKIVLFNESLSGITGTGLLEGVMYWEAVRSPEFIGLVQSVKSEKRSATREMEIDGRIYLCSATFVPGKEEIVTVFHDITEIRNIEKVKREFVANVSHELRTPLTAIKGFVETLEGEVTEEQRRYVEIVERNTDRLISIVRDLSLLSQLEDKSATRPSAAVDVARLIRDVLKLFEGPIAQKHVGLGLEIQENLPPVRGDAFQLEQVLVNLLDNAVKYTEAGKVSVTAAAREGRIVIEVTDTGIGIPRADIPRIFERFYVVDKSRSRSVGGTGLGLSIVKHIVLLHDGTIDVESSVGHGSRFVVTLPAAP